MKRLRPSKPAAPRFAEQLVPGLALRAHEAQAVLAYRALYLLARTGGGSPEAAKAEAQLRIVETLVEQAAGARGLSLARELFGQTRAQTRPPADAQQALRVLARQVLGALILALKREGTGRG